MRLYYKNRAAAEAVCHALRAVIAPVFTCPNALEQDGPCKGHHYVEGSDALVEVVRLAAMAFPPFKTRETLIARLHQTIKEAD